MRTRGEAFFFELIVEQIIGFPFPQMVEEVEVVERIKKEIVEVARFIPQK